MSVFADSSALVKLYADEAGSAQVRRLGDGLVVSRLARVEVVAALWRKDRAEGLDAAVVSTLLLAFRADWVGDPRPRFAVVADTDDVLRDAAALCGVHGLRAYDAVQLASAEAARRADPSVSTFACFDASLRRAAATRDFATLP